MVQRQVTPLSSVRSRGSGLSSVRVPKKWLREPPQPLVPSDVSSLSCCWSVAVRGTWSVTRRVRIGTRWGNWLPCTTWSSSPVLSGSVQVFQSLHIWPKIPWLSILSYAPPLQRRDPVGIPLGGPSPPAEICAPGPGWRAVRIHSPVGGNSSGPRIRPAGDHAPPLTLS